MFEAHPTIPKKIWLFWNQGIKQAPFIVRQCIMSWKRENPDWDIVLLDAKTITKYIKLDKLCKKDSHLSMAHQADLIRLQLLTKYGGVWADATSYCVKPLDEWINKAAASGFFVFHRPAPDRLISNWFMASVKGGPVTTKLKNQLISFWRQNTEYPYFIFHHTFEQLVSTDNVCREIWEKTQKISAAPPHKLWKLGLLQPIGISLKDEIESKQTFVYKLTWKYDHANYNESSILYYLLEERRKLLKLNK